MAECPAYFQFLQTGKKKPVTKQLRVAEDIIKMCYIQANETHFKSTWRKIINHVDKAVFKDIDVTNRDELDTAKRTSEYVLTFLRHWYNDIYLPEEGIGYVDVPVTGQLSSHVIEGIVPIIKLTQKPVIVYIDDVETSVSQMYNDLSVRGLLWLVSESLGSEIIGVEHLIMSPRGGFQREYLEIEVNVAQRVRKTLEQVITMIEKGYSFPSVTEQCTKCPFQRGCMI